MTLAIDYGVNGSEAFISKTAKMAGSVNMLGRAWGKYTKTIDGVSKLKLPGQGGGSGGSGGGFGNVLANASVFLIVGKLMERLTGERLKDFAADTLDWARMDFGYFLKDSRVRLKMLTHPLTSAIKRNSREMVDSFKLSASVLKDTVKMQYDDAKNFLSRSARRGRLLSRAAGIKLLGRGPAKSLGAWLTKQRTFPKPGGKFGKALAAGGALAAKYGKPLKDKMGKVIQKIVQASVTMFSKGALKAVGGLFSIFGVVAMLDSRFEEMVNSKITSFAKYISKKIADGWDVATKTWNNAFLTLATATNNPYYANSQFDRAEAAKAITPQQQKNFMTEERLKALEEGNEVIIKVEMQRMKKFFEEENAKRAKEIAGVQNLMIKQGRL